MARSEISRLRKLIRKAVVPSTADPNKRVCWANGDTALLVDAPPYKVGKQFPYENQRRARIVGMGEERYAQWEMPKKKSPEQLQIEATFLGRNHHALVGKKPTHKHGGQGTVRRSSRRRAFRPIIVES